jgi:hypothetical protein
MSFLSLVQNSLIASVGGFRPILRGLSNGEQDDDVVTLGQMNALQPPVPFSFSVLLQVNQSGAVYGMSDILDAEFTLPAGVFDGEGGSVDGLVFYLDTQRGSYWGGIEVSVAASEIFDIDNKLPTIDLTNCNGLVLVDLNDDVEAGETYTVAVTATGGGHSITRTFTLNIEAEA